RIPILMQRLGHLLSPQKTKPKVRIRWGAESLNWDTSDFQRFTEWLVVAKHCETKPITIRIAYVHNCIITSRDRVPALARPGGCPRPSRGACPTVKTNAHTRAL